MEEEKKYLDYEGLQTYHTNLCNIIEDNEQVTAAALDNLDDRLEDIENKDPYSKLEIDNLLEPITDKLDNIEEFAEVNVLSDWNQTDSDADDYIKNKPTSMPASDVSAWAKASSKPSYTKDEIGLSNVTNDSLVKRSEMGVASGVATLDSAGKVPSSQLPAYVDDVLEYDTRSAFPATGEGGKIYVDKSNNTSWRWSGSAYTQIKGDLTIGTTSGTAADGGIANTHYNNTSNPHSVTKAQVGLGSVVNTGDSDTPVSGGTTKFTTGGAYTELAKKADKSTTLSGYGITNAYTKTEIDTIIEQSSESIIEQNKLFPVFAYSTTSSSSDTKVATIVGSRPFKLYAGALVAVCFTEGFTPLNNMTLNVGGTGAKSIQCYFDIGSQGGYISNQIAELGVNRVCLFSYTGDTWTMIGYKKGTLAELTAGTDTNGQVWSAKDLIDALEQRVGFKRFSLPDVSSYAVHIATITIGAYQHVGFAFSLQGFSAIASGYFSLNFDGPGADIKTRLSYTCNALHDGFKFIVEHQSGYVYKVYMTGAYSSTSGNASIIIQPGVNTTIGDGSSVQVSGINIYEQRKLTPVDLASDLGGALLTRHTRLTDFDLAVLKQAVADQNLEKYGLRVGDQKTINGYTYVIADLNTMKGTVTPYRLTLNHVGLIVIPHVQHAWNSSGRTDTGADSRGAGYKNCDLHDYLKNTVLPHAKNDLGADNLLAHSKLLTNAVDTTGYNRFGKAEGCSSSWEWVSDLYISALSEVQVYGSTVWSSSGFDTGEACRLLEVFKKYSHTEIFGNEYPWLRDIASVAFASYAGNDGGARYDGVSDSGCWVAGLLLFH